MYYELAEIESVPKLPATKCGPSETVYFGPGSSLTEFGPKFTVLVEQSGRSRESKRSIQKRSLTVRFHRLSS